jgi:hypothetical protein
MKMSELSMNDLFWQQWEHSPPERAQTGRFKSRKEECCRDLRTHAARSFNKLRSKLSSDITVLFRFH